VTPIAMALVCAADVALGDPEGWPHPVRGIGAIVAVAERRVRRYARGNARRELVGGALLCASIVAGTYAVSRALIAAAERIDHRLAFAVTVTLGWTTLAARNLFDEGRSVIAALEADDLPRSRVRVARIVGRDTTGLDTTEISRATIETLAESTCDGIVAPLLALALGGVPLGLAFKAASTLDSMIGHIEMPYTFLGRAAARFDDLACFIPARLTALLIAVCAPAVGGDVGRALALIRTDGARHRSPNAGRPEAAMAGALGVRLGGPNRYDGALLEAPRIGADLEAPTVADARRAMRLGGAAATFAGALALTLCAALAGRRRGA
jgi:adenosylcobinamide-phosphate synthase